MMKVPDETGVWRKSSYSATQTDCVELAWAGAVRDSKNPGGPQLRLQLDTLLSAVKAGHLDR
jgi:hypothetical protein